jgi:hypothetical protein
MATPIPRSLPFAFEAERLLSKEDHPENSTAFSRSAGKSPLS